MVKLVLDQAKYMRNVIDAMGNISDMLVLEISNDGFRAQARDIATAWIVDIFLSASLFSEFNTDEPVILQVDLKDFSDFIKTAKSNDVLEITENKDDGVLILRLESSSIEKRIILRLTELGDFRFYNFVNNEFHSNCEMDSTLFSDAIKAAELGDEHVSITHSKDLLHFKASSSTRTAEAKIRYPNDLVDNLEFASGKFKTKSGQELTIPETHEATFGLSYLKNIAKLARTGSKLKFSLSNQAPLRIVFPIDEDEEQGYIAFAVAPRIIDE